MCNNIDENCCNVTAKRSFSSKPCCRTINVCCYSRGVESILNPFVSTEVYYAIYFDSQKIWKCDMTYNNCNFINDSLQRHYYVSEYIKKKNKILYCYNNRNLFNVEYVKDVHCTRIFLHHKLFFYRSFFDSFIIFLIEFTNFHGEKVSIRSKSWYLCK